MRITYSNGYRLWSSLHRGNPRRLFLATAEQPPIGKDVPVEIALPGRSDTLDFSPMVVARRSSGRFQAGIFVTLSDEQYAACRNYLGIGHLSSPLAPRQSASEGQGDRNTAAARVLVGDDDADILGFLERALSRFHVSITSVSDGATALRLVADLRPNLVLLDVLMPEVDGTEVCRRMRADENLAHIPVVLVSALDADELERLADQAGANDCLAKPVDLGALLNVVGEYIR